MAHFMDERVVSYLNDHLVDNMRHFSQRIDQEMSVSDPLPGVTMVDQVMAYNNQFAGGLVGFIQDHVITEHNPTRFTIGDDLPTSRFGVMHHSKSPNDILRTWKGNSGRGVQARDDPSGLHGDAYGGHGTYAGLGDNHYVTGITFCDQSAYGTQNHVEMYENTAYKQALNKPYMSHESTLFGTSTPESDARLLSRRIFRGDNEIPTYERRLYRRPLEKDIDEGLRGGERGCMLSGHDTSSLRRRVDHKNASRERWQPNAPVKMNLDMRGQAYVDRDPVDTRDPRYM